MAPVGVIGFMAGIPHQATPHYRAALYLVAETSIAFSRRGQTLELAFPTTTDHAQSRNQLAQLACDLDAEWLFMGDCDQTFPPDAIVRMADSMAAANLDVLSGFYCFKAPPYLPVLYTYDEALGGFRQLVNFPREKIFRVEGTGGGCLMVRTAVFRRIAEELERKPFDNRATPTMPWIMEDLSFALNCRDLGIPLWCDPSIESKHLATIEVGYREFEATPYAGPVVNLETSVLG